MKAYKTWDASGTMARVAILGEAPPGAALELMVAEIPDGSSTIFDPLAVIVTHAGGRVEHIAIHDTAERREEGAR